MESRPLAALTGGSGFVGSHLTEALLGAGFRVRALARRPDAPGWLKGHPVEIVKGDVRDPSCLGALVAGAALVVHAAGKTSARSEDEYMASNTGGTANVARAAVERAPDAHFVLVSSQAAAGPSPDGAPVKTSAPGRPVSAYGRSKLEGENEVRSQARLSYTILRPCAVYGPRETAIRDLFVAASKGFVPVFAGGRTRIQLVYAADVSAALLGALRRGGRRETFFVAHPEVLDYRQIAETLAGLPPKRPLLVPVPAPLIRLAGSVVGAASRLWNSPPVFDSEKAVEMLQSAWLCDVSETQAALGEPLRTDFRSGAQKTWDWYAANGWIRSDNIRGRKSI
ncbi:MAG: NAD-dependent epimerase/dehydratase family protein [Acidithiobacillales bacterium]